MRRDKVLVVLDETLAGDELDRVCRFLTDIAADCPIGSISGLIRHVEQFIPTVGVPMLPGDPMPISETGMPQFIMWYTPFEEYRDRADGEVLIREQLRQRMSEILQCSQPAGRYPTHRLLGLLSSDRATIELQYDAVVCVRPVCGDGVLLMRGDQLVCQTRDASGSADARVWFTSPEPGREAVNVCASR